MSSLAPSVAASLQWDGAMGQCWSNMTSDVYDYFEVNIIIIMSVKNINPIINVKVKLLLLYRWISEVFGFSL